AADSIPAIPIRLDQQPMLAPGIGNAVVFAQQIDQHATRLAGNAGGKSNFAGFAVEVVYEEHGVVAPVIPYRQHTWISRRENFEIAPADLRDFLAHANNALGPVEHRLGITALFCGIHMLVAERPAADD